ncbi:MAG: hypothetical protein ABH848_06425 [Candidatus Omnitrophota bacterium]
MRRIWIGLCIIFSYVLLFSASSLYADELSELKVQMKAMQKEMGKMQKKIEALEIQAPQAAKEAEGKKYAISKEVLEKFELGGEIEIEFVDTQKDTSTGEAEPHFQLDKIRLEPELQITEDIRFEADIDFDEDTADIDECYFMFQNLPSNSSLQIGKDDRFFKAEKYTERSPLAGTAFWKDEEWSLLLETEHEPFYAAFAWSQGLELDLKEVGEDDSSDVYEMIQDDTRKSSYNGIREVSLGLGLKKELGDFGEIDILGWGLYNQLSSADISFLKSNLNSYTSDDDDQYRAGINLEYELGDFSLVAQYIDAQDGKLDRETWFIQPSCKVELPFGWKYCNGHRLLARYGRLDVDNAKSFSTPAAWDREELTLAVITDIAENFKLKSEYTINEEDTGNGEVDNNELVMQLEYEF